MKNVKLSGRQSQERKNIMGPICWFFPIIKARKYQSKHTAKKQKYDSSFAMARIRIFLQIN